MVSVRKQWRKLARAAKLRDGVPPSQSLAITCTYDRLKLFGKEIVASGMDAPKGVTTHGSREPGSRPVDNGVTVQRHWRHHELGCWSNGTRESKEELKNVVLQNVDNHGDIAVYDRPKDLHQAHSTNYIPLPKRRKVKSSQYADLFVTYSEETSDMGNVAS